MTAAHVSRVREGQWSRVAWGPGATPIVGDRLTVQVWDHVGSALRHDEGSRWFSSFLGDHVSLVYMPDTERRQVSPERSLPSDIMSFADGYPFLLLSEESLEDLNARLAAPVTMTRFRPNLVISGCLPYAEDHFSRLSIGSVAFRAVKRCERCSVVSVNPSSGERGQEPLRTLARYRLEDSKVWFGMNLIHDGPGVLRLGDEVRLAGAA